MRESDTAFLDLDVARGIARFVATAEEAGLNYERSERGLRVAARLGAINLAGEGAGTRLTIRSDDAAQLQALREQLNERLGTAGLVPIWERAAAGRPANLSLARVAVVERLSPSYARVAIVGDDLARFAEGGLHFRLLSGPGGADWPWMDAAGATHWPDGIGAWHRPVYTIRELEPLGQGGARLTFDVFLHDGGRTTEWTGRVAPGAEIAITGPGGSELPAPTGWIGMVGDETAVPVIARMLAAAVPDTRGEAILFVPQDADIQSIPHPPGVTLRWVRRGTSETPLAALGGLEIPARDRFVFFAAERSEAIEARSVLAAAGLAKGEFLAPAYWNGAG